MSGWMRLLVVLCGVSLVLGALVGMSVAGDGTTAGDIRGAIKGGLIAILALALPLWLLLRGIGWVITGFRKA